MPRSSLPLAFLAFALACGGADITTEPPHTSGPDAALASGSAEPREVLAARIARALDDAGFRADVHRALAASPHAEGKVRLSAFLNGNARARAALAGAGARPLRAAELAAAERIEIYLPVPAHRAAWAGGPELLVGTIGQDGTIPVAFDRSGRPTPLDPAVPPAMPVLAVVPLESDLVEATDGTGTEAICTACEGSESGAGLYMTASQLSETFESWLKGRPEIEVLALGQKGTSDSLTSYQCGGERAVGPYYFDQNALTWSGDALILSQAQLDAYNALHPGQSIRLFFMEDDDTSCEIRADNADLRRVIQTVDSLARGYSGGTDAPGAVGRVYRNYSMLQKLYSVVASAVRTNDDLIGNAVEDVVTGENRPGYNWIIKGENGRTNGAIRLEMR
jgi:hypothetical protein